MKKLAIALLACASASTFANQGELDARFATQGDYSGVTLDYVMPAPAFIENTKNAYYEAKVIYLSGSAGSADFSHMLIGASYGISDKINDQFDWFAQAGLAYANNDLDIEILGTSTSTSDSGLELLAKAGVKSAINEQLSYKAYLAIEDETVLGADIRYKHSDKLSVIAGIETFSDSRLSVGVEYSF